MKHSCPNCGKESPLDKSNSYRPFCSERCRLIDLGDWLSEKNTIADEESLPEEENEKLYPQH